MSTFNIGYKLGDAIGVEQLAAINGAAGYHWFEKSSMRFFNSRICPEVFPANDGWYFVSSERYETEPRRYTARILREDGQIDELGEFQQHATKQSAIKAIKAHLGL